jgi:hypothetical protein
METLASEHVREKARRHILISVQKNNQAVPGLSPGDKLPLKVPQEHSTGAFQDPMLTEIAALLFVDGFLAGAATWDIDRYNTCGMAMPSLELSPSPSPQIAIVHTRVRNASC